MGKEPQRALPAEVIGTPSSVAQIYLNEVVNTDLILSNVERLIEIFLKPYGLAFEAIEMGSEQRVVIQVQRDEVSEVSLSEVAQFFAFASGYPVEVRLNGEESAASSMPPLHINLPIALPSVSLFPELLANLADTLLLETLSLGEAPGLDNLENKALLQEVISDFPIANTSIREVKEGFVVCLSNPFSDLGKHWMRQFLGELSKLENVIFPGKISVEIEPELFIGLWNSVGARARWAIRPSNSDELDIVIFGRDEIEDERGLRAVVLQTCGRSLKLEYQEIADEHSSTKAELRFGRPSLVEVEQITQSLASSFSGVCKVEQLGTDLGGVGNVIVVSYPDFLGAGWLESKKMEIAGVGLPVEIIWKPIVFKEEPNERLLFEYIKINAPSGVFFSEITREKVSFSIWLISVRQDSFWGKASSKEQFEEQLRSQFPGYDWLVNEEYLPDEDAEILRSLSKAEDDLGARMFARIVNQVEFSKKEKISVLGDFREFEELRIDFDLDSRPLANGDLLGDGKFLAVWMDCVRQEHRHIFSLSVLDYSTLLPMHSFGSNLLSQSYGFKNCPEFDLYVSPLEMVRMVYGELEVGSLWPVLR